MKIDGQKLEKLREVKNELVLLEKQIGNGEEEKRLIEKERDQARKGENCRTEELKRLRKENEGLVKESTSLKDVAEGMGRWSRSKGMRQTDWPRRLSKNLIA